MVLLSELGKANASQFVTVRVRVIDMFCSPLRRVYLTTSDSSGAYMLVEVKESISQALNVGAIVQIRGSVVLSKGRIMMRTTDIHKLQEVEDGFQQLANISLASLSDLPDYEGDRWVKPRGDMERIKSAVFAKNKNSEYAIFGILFCCLAVIPIPFLNCVFCIGGLILILFGLLTEKTAVTSVEQAFLKKAVFSLLLSHHTADKLHRCLHLKIGSRQLHLCARCTGSIIGLVVGFPLISLLSKAKTFENYFVFIAALLTLPAFIDWTTQKLGLRESHNINRLVTGVLLGLASALALTMDIPTRVFLTAPFLVSLGVVAFISRNSERKNYVFVLK